MSDKPNLMMLGNPRYQPKALRGIFGYDNLYRSLGEVELATMHVLADIGVIPEEDYALLTDPMRRSILAIRTTDVDQREREDEPGGRKATKHDVRA